MFRRRSAFRRSSGRSWWHTPLRSQISGASGNAHRAAPVRYTLLLTLLVVAVVAAGTMFMTRAPTRRDARPRRTARSRDLVDRLQIANEEALQSPAGGSVVVVTAP